ncbi:2-oxo-4-hydroxy-4-carboxy-5-ureidoimidazoline decarboxylase [Granulicella rosea]|uniref:2-oxo-4-hydroxy-4-carboxy-5-ureidoimidazoline decarboxylase n=1 Tax=Granulicella rosea TaxID=474952 RepID=A0A239KY89_9BACT|nr:2-oxo-4-hydroxy-4-carboxy-5-ureidoimidazoline decarboxylase [Granulicella rosea]SNT22224.1 2-oxo-4-hydroxy-4-carboxy-5-ureidoimidazoline decarboxylase [Granulicella rosea]
MTNDRLDRWNELPAQAAAEAVLPCNGSTAWADGLAAKRPVADEASLLALSDAIWSSLTADDWQQAFDSHPRIGERKAKAATDSSLKWSSQEQSKAMAADSKKDSAAALAEGNAAYEAKFGRIFLICATGKSAAEILASLHQRLNSTPEAELLEAAEQQRQITQLRLRRWLGEP